MIRLLGLLALLGLLRLLRIRGTTLRNRHGGGIVQIGFFRLVWRNRIDLFLQQTQFLIIGTRLVDPLAARGMCSPIGCSTCSPNASDASTILDFFSGVGSFISGESISS